MARNTHEAIVTEETYAQAQKVLKSCKRKKTPAKPNQRFRGLLKCAVCGRTLEYENENFPDALEKQIQECQTAISRCKAKQADAFEDYAEGRITRQEYLTRKAEAVRQHDDMTASYMELSVKRVELQKAADSSEKMDLGRYACVGELTRELLTELIREIRISGENDLEIVWNFRE